MVQFAHQKVISGASGRLFVDSPFATLKTLLPPITYYILFTSPQNLCPVRGWCLSWEVTPLSSLSKSWWWKPSSAVMWRCFEGHFQVVKVCWRFQENELLIVLNPRHAWTIRKNWAHSHYSIRQRAFNGLSILNGIDIEKDSCMRN